MKCPIKGPDSDTVNTRSRMLLRNTVVYTTIDIKKGVTQTVLFWQTFDLPGEDCLSAK